jgi:hypothetical protein
LIEIAVVERRLINSGNNRTLSEATANEFALQKRGVSQCRLIERASAKMTLFPEGALGNSIP